MRPRDTIKFGVFFLGDGCAPYYVARDMCGMKCEINFVFSRMKGKIDALRELLQQNCGRRSRGSGCGLNECKFQFDKRGNGFGNLLFCGQYGPVRRIDFRWQLATPNAGNIYFAQFVYPQASAVQLHSRVAMILDRVEPRGSRRAASWERLAHILCGQQVRVLVGLWDDIASRTHPLLNALETAIPTTVIQPKHGSPFFICLLGDVRGRSLKLPDVKHTNPPVNKYNNTAAFKGVDVYIKRPEIPVDKLWKAIVCFRQPSLVLSLIHISEPTRPY